MADASLRCLSWMVLGRLSCLVGAILRAIRNFLSNKAPLGMGP